MSRTAGDWHITEEIYGCAFAIRDSEGRLIAQVMHIDPEDGVEHRRAQAQLNAAAIIRAVNRSEKS